MEKICYRVTLDAQKGGVQKVLHGFFTGDVTSRRIAISITAGSVSCKISDPGIAAIMYVTKDSGVTNYGACEIVDNIVFYDVLQADTDVAGITEMQLKIVAGDTVLYAPMFALEVQESKVSDTAAETTPQFTALEAALAKAQEVYDRRLVSIDLKEDLTFIVTYADETTYESDALTRMKDEVNASLLSMDTKMKEFDDTEAAREKAFDEARGELNVLVADINDRLERGLFNGPSGTQGPKGEKGDPGDKGEKGDPGKQGERGDSGVFVPISGMFSLAVDEDGNLKAYYVAGDSEPEFRLDENGNLSYITAKL